ncbi:BlaI/MecI/CopY family transcriptional regulator [Hymenobacter oligotrophus]|uniref:BlaI/MecI/CopY family transcriptional regulator n=1 Tax=Hymenobacter oligotrophus TaxID=2319843 RepID=A0A3B7R0L5_9BACT|nr:BlaI/MecI/CopY family transcriptional regulator [Hymenobacter oligotrophus]AYA38968.1 BlaI/MecI/CopY family transcriptional regulator [Hymenobacter oligotrophus]
MEKLPELTRAEEQVMQVLWRLGPAFVKEVLAEMPAPQPAYNTVSTIIRILEQKGYVGHEAFGRTHRYHALVAQDDYRRHSLRKLLGGYFGNSFGRLVSFFAKEENLTAQQLDELLRHAQQDLNQPPRTNDDDAKPA